MNALDLTIPTADEWFTLDTDASDIAFGSEPSQVQNGANVFHTVAFSYSGVKQILHNQKRVTGGS